MWTHDAIQGGYARRSRWPVSGRGVEGGRPPRVSGQRPEHPTKFTDPIYEIAMEKLFGTTTLCRSETFSRMLVFPLGRGHQIRNLLVFGITTLCRSETISRALVVIQSAPHLTPIHRLISSTRATIDSSHEPTDLDCNRSNLLQPHINICADPDRKLSKMALIPLKERA